MIRESRSRLLPSIAHQMLGLIGRAAQQVDARRRAPLDIAQRQGGVVGRQHRGKNRHQDQKPQNDRAHLRRPVPAQPPENIL